LIQFAVEGSHSGAYSHLRFDLVEGRSESEIRKILDATHEVLLETLKVPKHDRYQVVHEHKRSRMIVEDTGLGFVRSDQVLMLQVTSRPRSREMKENFYRLLVERLATRCGISPDDVIVNFVTNPMKIGHSALVGRSF
jgi:hypothetical protein